MKIIVTVSSLTIAILGILSGYLVGCDEEIKPFDVYLDEETEQYVVEHPENGRKWLRCPIGQKWDTSSKKCKGSRDDLTYIQAIEACPQGFTLPSNEDFASILCNLNGESAECMGPKYDSCNDCSICAAMFPGDPGCGPAYLLSGSSWNEAEELYDVIKICFDSGCVKDDATYGDDPEFHVRCIKTQD